MKTNFWSIFMDEYRVQFVVHTFSNFCRSLVYKGHDIRKCFSSSTMFVQKLQNLSSLLIFVGFACLPFSIIREWFDSRKRDIETLFF